ncbi:hypothetical protein BDN72DRAFT_962785 [Pluteus cervinus]|uniref:Uncharacterized protein n=1 Tax=Pluteus cervinus TaxID=181527 RepID=A0ACD3AH53_9AGAR|nr:hypothetical protein BDN72DRAFT_962785 [Pluteus cervinus]
MTENAMIIAQLDAEIELLENQLILLRRTRNSHTLVNKLPPEVLSEVFLEVQHSDGVARETYNVIPMTHVCHDWRELALDCASLWCHIDGSVAKWLDFCWDRSKEADLIIDLPYSILEFPIVATLNQQNHLHQTQAVRLRNNHNRTVFPLLQNTDYAFPRLEAVWLHKFELSGPAFSGGAPRLRILVLEDCRVYPSAIKSFSTVTTLVLTRPFDGFLQVQDAITLLSCLPQVERLLLGQLHSQSTSQPLPPCHLPHLIFLSLAQVTDKWLTQFLSSINFPDVATVMVGLSANRNCVEVSRVLSRYIQGHDCLTMMSGTPDSLRLDFSTLGRPSASGHHFVLDLLFRTGQKDIFASDVLRTILPKLPLDSIERLDLTYDDRLHQEHFCFEHFLNVEILRISDIHFLLSLKFKSQDPQRFGSSNLAPALRKLIFGSPFDPATLPQDDQLALLQTLDARAMVGLVDVIMENRNVQLRARHLPDQTVVWDTVPVEGYQPDMSLKLSDALNDWYKLTTQ